jgi:hypothetical protein
MTFKTTNGISFTVNIKTKDVLAVKNLVKYPDGKPVDILEASETGTLAAIYGDLETFVNVMFVLCLDQIKEYFDVQKYDEQNQKTYTLFPDQSNEAVLVKASRWFGGILDGDSLIGMIQAFNEAIVNFIPSENRRRAMLTILAKEQEVERLETEYRIATVNRMYETTKNTMERRWENLTEQQARELIHVLDGQFDESMSVPELSESILPNSVIENSN